MASGNVDSVLNKLFLDQNTRKVTADWHLFVINSKVKLLSEIQYQGFWIKLKKKTQFYLKNKYKKNSLQPTAKHFKSHHCQINPKKHHEILSSRKPNLPNRLFE